MADIFISTDFKKIIRFLLVGGLNTLVGFVIFAMAIYITEGNVALSLLVNIGAGVVFNFFSYGVGVFKSLGVWCFGRFVAAYVLLFVINYVALRVEAGWGLSVYLAQFINIFYMAPLSYYLLNRFVYFK